MVEHTCYLSTWEIKAEDDQFWVVLNYAEDHPAWIHEILSHKSQLHGRPGKASLIW